MRASVLSIKQQDYVLAGHSIGSGSARILFQNILPNALTPLIVQGTLGIATAILDAAALSFLGLGAQPPTPEWGSMIGQERNQVFTAPHLIIFPGIALMLTVLGFNLLGRRPARRPRPPPTQLDAQSLRPRAPCPGDISAPPPFPLTGPLPARFIFEAKGDNP